MSYEEEDTCLPDLVKKRHTCVSRTRVCFILTKEGRGVLIGAVYSMTRA
jgi:hypothetical protein